jgi:hypothetical protein
MKQYRNDSHHVVDILFVLALLCVFAVSAMILIILGANIYKVTVSHMNDNFSSRTSYAYIVQKIRQHDAEDSVSSGSFNGRPSIILKDNIDGTDYDTYLYESDGYLCELLTRADQKMNTDAGTHIMPVTGFRIDRINDNLYHIMIKTDNSHNVDLYVSSRCDRKEASE